MTPIEVLRGNTPEEVAQQFNQRETEGWKPVSQGIDSAEKPHFLSIYRPSSESTEETKLSTDSIVLTEEQLCQIHYSLRQLYPKGKPSTSIAHNEARYNAVLKQIEADYGVKRSRANIAHLFPPDANVPMSKLHSVLMRCGMASYEGLLAYDGSGYVKNLGAKGDRAIRAIQVVLRSHLPE